MVLDYWNLKNMIFIKNKNKFYLWLRFSFAVFFAFLILPTLTQAQNPDVIGTNVLLKEYLFPISSYEKSGNPELKRGIECDQFAGWDISNDSFNDFSSCQDLQPFATPGEQVTEWLDSGSTIANMKAKFSFTFNVTQQANYVFQLTASNAQDNFDKLTHQQIDFILNDLGKTQDDLLANIGEGITADDLTVLGTQGDQTYELFKSLVFSVYVDGEAPENQKGFIFIKATDSTQLQTGEAVIDNLKPGDHTIYLHFLSDFYYDFSSKTLPDYFSQFSNADLNADKILDTNPIINSVDIDSINPADDIIGIRIYQNTEYLDPLTWYNQNVINPSANVEQLKVDGYDAIRDDRTVYVNAANLFELNVCNSGPDDGKECSTYADCSGGTDINNICGRKFFYTNIYVLAYNQAATASTVNIFNQMLDNWQFNINIDPLERETIKAKFQRDVKRLSDLRNIRTLLENYKASHGKYPAMDAGSFVKNHSISTWPSWQATLGNELGSALPVDPFNIMATENKQPFNCQDPIEKLNCQNICTRDSAGKALTGCPTNQQCIDNQYCSICPSGYDAQTCWDDVNLKFAYSALRSGCGDKIDGSFNLGGTPAGEVQSLNDCIDGSYVYQYTALDVDGDGKAGDAYLLNYRLEYTEPDICTPGQCIFGNRCYQPGSCLAGCDANGENCQNPDFKNLYCLFGNWLSSCGDGFVQNQCGETCDPALPLTVGESWCDTIYGAHDWYNEKNIKGTCSAYCQLQEVASLGYTPKPYTADPADIDCGGYCGDKIVQNTYNEQCDEGALAAAVRKADAGVAADVQYMCSGAGGGEVAPLKTLAANCANYSTDWYLPADNACSGLTTDSTGTVRVSKDNDNDLLALGGFQASYTFDVPRSSTYTFKISSANLGDDLNSLTDQQIDYIFSLKTEAPNDTLYNITLDHGLSIPEFGEIAPDDSRKYDLLRSLIYSVYLDGNDPNNRIGFITLPATNTNQIQEGLISLGVLNQGNHTVYLHFVGDHFYLPFGSLTLPEYLDNFANVDLDANQELDVNPVLYSVSLFSPELGVGNCKTYGGWCGDGVVQLEFGEQCDTKNYFPPSPAETVNLVKNASFENIFSPWQIIQANASLDENEFFVGRYSLRIDTTTNTEFWLKQFNNLFKDKHYSISLRLKLITGAVNSVEFETGDQGAGESWSGDPLSGNPSPMGVVSDEEIAGWKLYQLTDFSPAKDGYKFRIKFTATANSSFYIDDIKIIPLDPSVRPQYQCGTELISGKICQYRGGYCGDGQVQKGFGETCDDRVGLSCTANADCGKSGFCDGNGICQSVNCNSLCKSTFCGDGLVQRPNSEGLNEICDWNSDPLCSFDCQHIKIGGSCSNDTTTPCDPNSSKDCRQCSSNLSCTIRNFGDIDKKCLGARGSLGCKANSDCILGYYCDLSTTKCEPEISTYLKYHPEGITSLTLPAPSTSAYDINNSICPDLQFVGTEGEKQFVADRCTGINWESTDNISRINWSYKDAVENACGGATRLPTILELYSLVRQTNQKLFYSDKLALRLCPLKCAYDENDIDLCSDCPDDNYLYWSNTCVEGNDINENGIIDLDECTKALAINFKYGSIEEYSTTDNFKAHCLKDTVCGNGSIEEGETCEFFKGANGQFIEQNITRQCSEYGYDGGFLHCDPVSCNFKFDNCYFNSRINQTCEEVCQGQKTLACESVGLNVNQADDYYNIIDQALTIANDQTLMDIDPNGNCFVPGRPVDCNYPFVDRGANCRDTGTGQFAPYRSEYSFCNCLESIKCVNSICLGGTKAGQACSINDDCK